MCWLHCIVQALVSVLKRCNNYCYGLHELNDQEILSESIFSVLTKLLQHRDVKHQFLIEAVRSAYQQQWWI